MKVEHTLWYAGLTFSISPLTSEFFIDEASGCQRMPKDFLKKIPHYKEQPR